MSTDAEANKYPATERQALEWGFFLSTGQRSSNVNHVGIIETCDPALIQKVFKLLIDRHESLRTIFNYTDEELSQVICTPESFLFELRYVDFSEKPAVDFEVGKWLEEFGFTLFEREGGRLFDAAVLLIGRQSCIIALTMDHMISDAMSVEILKRDFAVYYQQILTQGSEPLQPLMFQMKDYAMWERDYNDSWVGRRNLQYWKDTLSGKLCKFELAQPIRSKFSESLQEKSVGVYNLFLSSVFFENKKDLCENKFLYLTASVILWLSTLSEQRNIILGIPFSARDSDELDNVVGYLVLGIYLRVDLHNVSTLKQLIPIVLDKYVDAIEHRHYSRKELDIEIDPFCAAFINNVSLLPLDIDYEGPHEELLFTEVPMVYPVSCNLRAYNNGWLLSFHYSKRIFGVDGIDRIFGIFRNILDGDQ